MNTKDHNKLIELAYTGGHLFSPVNQNAFDLCNMSGIGETILFDVKTPRDYKFHQCYFVLIGFIWGYMPDKFKSQVPKQYFHKWLQTLRGDYKVVFSFQDGKELIEYNSISFGRMSQQKFEDYIREQLPYIYENVIGAFYEGEIYDGILGTIEEEFKKFLSKL